MTSEHILPEPPPMPIAKRPPYWRPLGEFECGSCGAVTTVPEPEKEPEIIDGICIFYGVNFDEWLQSQGWIRHDMKLMWWTKTPQGKRKKTGVQWTEYECQDCASGIFARKRAAVYVGARA